jgi:hypothetical protein
MWPESRRRASKNAKRPRRARRAFTNRRSLILQRMVANPSSARRALSAPD